MIWIGVACLFPLANMPIHMPHATGLILGVALAQFGVPTCSVPPLAADQPSPQGGLGKVFSLAVVVHDLVPQVVTVSE